MSKMQVDELLLYRWRYPIAITAICILLVSLLIATIFYVPGGLSAKEMNGATKSMSLPLQSLFTLPSDQLRNLPYHLLQAASLSIFGVSTESIKLPSLLLSLSSVLCLYGLARLWFRRNVAVTATVIVVVTSIFLYATQHGTPLISVIFFPLIILLCVSMLSNSEQYRGIWLVFAAFFAGLSLYTPLQFYGSIAFSATMLVHPHARFVIRRLPLWSIITSLLVFAAVISPLATSLIKSPAYTLDLLGLSSFFDGTWSVSTILLTLQQLIGLAPLEDMAVLSPAFNYGLLVLALVGIYRLFTAKYTAKSYIMAIWSLALLPLIFVAGNSLFHAYVPVVLLAIYGVDQVFGSWYRLFPNNPYARAAGLLPLGIVVLALIAGGFGRFIYGFHYAPDIAAKFSQDLKLIQKELDGNPEVTLVVKDEERAFYAMMLRENNYRNTRLAVRDVPLQYVGTTIVQGAIAPDGSSPSAQALAAGRPPVTEVIVDTHSNSADRFYVYKTNAE